MIKVLAICSRQACPEDTGTKLGQCFPGIVFTMNPGLSQGIDQARSDLPELILFEDTLPDDGVLEYCRAIKQDPMLGRGFIVLVTDRAREAAFSLKALKAGADGLLGKPVRESELIPLLSLLLRRHAGKKRTIGGKCRRRTKTMPTA
jgi:DNA-binding response OmpR family regulator